MTCVPAWHCRAPEGEHANRAHTEVDDDELPPVQAEDFENAADDVQWAVKPAQAEEQDEMTAEAAQVLSLGAVRATASGRAPVLGSNRSSSPRVAPQCSRAEPGARARCSASASFSDGSHTLSVPSRRRAPSGARRTGVDPSPPASCNHGADTAECR